MHWCSDNFDVILSESAGKSNGSFTAVKAEETEINSHVEAFSEDTASRGSVMTSNGSALEFEHIMSSTTVGQLIRSVIQTARLPYSKSFMWFSVFFVVAQMIGFHTKKYPSFIKTYHCRLQNFITFLNPYHLTLFEGMIGLQLKLRMFKLTRCWVLRYIYCTKNIPKILLVSANWIPWHF